MKYTLDLQHAENQKQANHKFLKRLKEGRPPDLDSQFHRLHHEAFASIDCLECANCCKTTSPIFLESDISRLARSLKTTVSEFINTYLTRDGEGDYVLKAAPCPFLGLGNRCLVYEKRPKACREYPHTNRKRMYQITQLTFKNSMVCPAVSRIVAKLRSVFPTTH